MTGRAKFGADMAMPGQLVGRVLRSPHPHARISGIDASAAARLPGVKAIVTRDDFKDQPSEFIPAGEMMINYRDVVRNVMAREKALYEGHPVAAVAATSAGIAKQALKLIKVDYEVLPHVIDVVEAMQPGAPLLDESMITAGVEPAPKTPSNVAKRVEFGHGDIAAGFAEADVIVERSFTTKPVHQGYIEPHACVASVSEDGQADVWVTTQGHWIVRAHCARLLGWDVGKIRVTSSEIGGGFGGKTVVYLEPVALALSKKARRPVKMVMTREEVFRASGPTSGAHVRIKIGAKKDGRIVAAEGELKYQAGAFAGSPVQPGAMCAFAPYDLENVKVVGYDVVTNRPKVAAYRAPGGPISEFAVESVVDEIAKKLGIDPIELRLKNAAKQGTKAAYGPKFGPVGLVETLEAAKGHAHWRTPLGKNQGRGVASGFWFNIGGETAVSMSLNEDGTLSLTAGTPDIGGLRASLCMMAAEELGVDLGTIRVQIGDTGQLGYNFLTGGSRATFSSGMATVEAAREVMKEACKRAAKLWELPEDAVEYNGRRRASGRPQCRQAPPMTLQRYRRHRRQDRRADRGLRAHQCARRGAQLRHPRRRRRGRPRDRQGDGGALHRHPGRGPRHPPELRRGPVPGRRGAGHRLGAQRGVHLRRRRQAAEPGLPRLPRAGRLRPADDRHGDRRGAEPAPSLRRARRRRDADRAADGGDRQRHRRRHRRALHRPADVAAQGAGRAGRGAGQGRGEDLRLSCHPGACHRDPACNEAPEVADGWMPGTSPGMTSAVRTTGWTAKPASPERIGRYRRGRFSELIAAAALMAKGYRILARRCAPPTARSISSPCAGRRLAFVEVKRRATRPECEAALDPRQAGRIARAAEFWVSRNARYRDHDRGLDAVLVMPGRLPVHLPDALHLEPGGMRSWR